MGKIKKAPKTRSSKIATQEAHNEILIYDLLTNKAHCLNETSAIIWQSCDGKTSVQEIAKNRSIPEEYVTVALIDFQEANLIEENFESDISVDRFSRRKILMKAGVAAMALPLMTSLVAPVSAQSASASCLRLNGVFDATGGPYPDLTSCTAALINQASSICCSGGINPAGGFIFAAPPAGQCTGFCGGAP